MQAQRVLRLANSYPSSARVELFTSKFSPPCRSFEKKFAQLALDFPAIVFERHELHGCEKVSMFRDHRVTHIPCVLFFRGGEEVRRLTAIKTMYPAIEKTCTELSR